MMRELVVNSDISAWTYLDKAPGKAKATFDPPNTQAITPAVSTDNIFTNDGTPKRRRRRRLFIKRRRNKGRLLDRVASHMRRK
jgi:hypothetical protein